MFMFQAHIPANYMIWITLAICKPLQRAVVVTAMLNLALTLTIAPLLTANLDDSYETYKGHIDSKNGNEAPSLLAKIFKMIKQLFAGKPYIVSLRTPYDMDAPK